MSARPDVGSPPRGGSVRAADRLVASGKFLRLGSEKIYVRGVTYGPFRPEPDGSEYHTPDVVRHDFARVHASGFNAVRLYTVPPRWLLDLAAHYDLQVMVGLPWEQHVDFLTDPSVAVSIERRVREGVRACADHPAVLCYAIGNEIPAPIVRWLGPAAVERFLERLFRTVKEEDPSALVTYVNYPSTEYLTLPFLDLVCFNVYLEEQDRLNAYLARLQNLAGDRPLLMAEIGLDSRRNGEDTQASTLAWQVRSVFAASCAGAFVFAWTDEWHRGGHDIDDWDFGLTTRDRRPKPALAAVATALADTPVPHRTDWPHVSVVVCTYNGNRTIRATMNGLRRIDYPSFDVIVVDDGSVEPVASIVAPYGVRYIRTPNQGLSAARNVGLAAATGEIVAYIDDDAYPDPHWLKYLAAVFLQGDWAGVGGPNLPPPGDGPLAECVAHSPGGPIHVLFDDVEAEHIPGCNMAFRRAALDAIDGFDVQFNAAGDDVDLCWRIQQNGGRITYCPGAMIWHHRRSSVAAYLRQQRGYGKAEAMLERKWPEKYNVIGHIPWSGRIYARYLTHLLGTTRRIYHGTWGSALFQSVYQPTPGTLRSLLMMPEWYLVIVALAVLSVLGLVWRPLASALPFLMLAVGAAAVHAMLVVASVRFDEATSRGGLWKRRALTTLLHLLQPLARLHGRMREGLTPWRRLAPAAALPVPRHLLLWTEMWQAPESRLRALETALQAQRIVALRGGDYDRWDLHVPGGILGGVRLLATVEEHGAGRQLTRVRTWPSFAGAGWLFAATFATVGLAAGLDRAWVVAALLGGVGLATGGRALYESSVALTSVMRALDAMRAAEAAGATEVLDGGRLRTGTVG